MKGGVIVTLWCEAKMTAHCLSERVEEQQFYEEPRPRLDQEEAERHTEPVETTQLDSASA